LGEKFSGWANGVDSSLIYSMGSGRAGWVVGRPAQAAPRGDPPLGGRASEGRPLTPP